MTEYAISRGEGTLLDVGYFDAGVPRSRMWEKGLLDPPVGQNWLYNLEHWLKSGCTVVMGPVE